MQWKYKFYEQKQRLESACLKILNVLNRLDYAEMRNSYKSYKITGKRASEIHVTYASPEVIRKKAVFIKKMKYIHLHMQFLRIKRRKMWMKRYQFVRNVAAGF